MIEKTYTLSEIESLQLPIVLPSIVFLEWDLGAGKTTLTKSIIKNMGVKEDITSPTYTYYNKYVTENGTPIFHFDLYRLQNYDEFFAIWWEEILDNNEGLILIEWPDILKEFYNADLELQLQKTENIEERIIKIQTSST